MPGTYLLVSKPGKGKTTLACTLEHPTFLLDIDCKADRMMNIRPLIEKGLVVVHPIKVPLIGESLTKKLKSTTKPVKDAKLDIKEPQGYFETIKVLEKIVNNDPEFERFKTIVVDSLSRLDEHLQRLILYYRIQGAVGENAGTEMGWPGWGKFKQTLEELFTVLVQIDKNIICCAHELVDKEEDPITNVSRIIGYYPNISGSIKAKLAGYFDEVYWLDNRVVQDKERGKIRKYYVITADRDKPCRTSMILNGEEGANLAELVEKQKLITKKGA